MSPTPYSGNQILQTLTCAKNYNAFLVSLVKRFAPSGARVLDAGSGIGTFAASLCETRAFGRGQIVCLDPDPAQAAVSREKGFATETGIAALEDGSFDYIYSLNVIEHIADDVAAVREWAAKLKPGGRMLLYVPAHQFLTSSMDRAVGHCRRYTRKILTQTAERAGLSVVKPARYADSLGFMFSLLYKFTVRDASLGVSSVKFFDAIFPITRLIDPVFARVFGKNVWIVATKRPI